MMILFSHSRFSGWEMGYEGDLIARPNPLFNGTSETIDENPFDLVQRKFQAFGQLMPRTTLRSNINLLEDRQPLPSAFRLKYAEKSDQGVEIVIHSRPRNQTMDPRGAGG